MVKNGYYRNEGLGLTWDCIEVFWFALFITIYKNSVYNDLNKT